MYTANFSDPRTRRRAIASIGFVLSYLDDTKPRLLSRDLLDRHLGKSTNKLSAWLRGQLLTCTDHHYNMHSGKPKSYVLNTAGLECLKQALNLNSQRAFNSSRSSKQAQALRNQQLAVDWAHSTYDTDPVEYEDKSHRLWHPIQQMRKTVRNQYLSDRGLAYQYDIVCAAPSLLHQLSWRYSFGHYLETIAMYTLNRTHIRNKLSAETGIPVANIKVLINSLFCGASLGANPQFACWDLCGGNPQTILYLKQHPFIVALLDDIRLMWQYLRPELELTPKLQLLTSGKTRRVVMYPKNKWNLYFQLERSVLDTCRVYLSENNQDYFLIHDAFASGKVDTRDLQQYIWDETGFDVSFDEERLL